mmetsp:Transcript_31784/g.62950  ORF Transcript_31784/g.62950 Transcript_31784/m.62950 type:complete len:82 (+) Transcript_31784:737-982(+)
MPQRYAPAQTKHTHTGLQGTSTVPSSLLNGRHSGAGRQAAKRDWRQAGNETDRKAALSKKEGTYHEFLSVRDRRFFFIPGE